MCACMSHRQLGRSASCPSEALFPRLLAPPHCVTQRFVQVQLIASQASFSEPDAWCRVVKRGPREPNRVLQEGRQRHVEGRWHQVRSRASRVCNRRQVWLALYALWRTVLISNAVPCIAMHLELDYAVRFADTSVDGASIVCLMRTLESRCRHLCKQSAHRQTCQDRLVIKRMSDAPLLESGSCYYFAMACAYTEHQSVLNAWLITSNSWQNGSAATASSAPERVQQLCREQVLHSVDRD